MTRIIKDILCTIIVCISCWLLWNCSGEDTSKTLNESEYYFDERLASISSDNDSVCWIGSEYGTIYKITNEKHTPYSVASERIYFVRHIGKEFWIGVRNGGLQKFSFDGTHFHLQKTYSIAVKHANYSAYDAVEADGKLFFGTSQGLFVLPKDTTTHPLLLYPYTSSPQYVAGQSCVVKKLVQVGRHQLIATTDNGLLHINTHNLKITRTQQGRKIDDVLYYQGKTYILTEQLFEVYNHGKCATYKLHFNASTFYIAEGTFYFLSTNIAHLSQDLKSFKRIYLRHEIPMNGSHIVIPNYAKNAMMLVTNKALWRIPVHLDVFSSNIPIVAACVDNDNLWYVNAKNEIFVKPKNSKKAKKIYDFICENPIVDIVVKNNVLYYLTEQREIKRIKLSMQLCSNYISMQHPESYQSVDKVTAMISQDINNKSTLLIGIQDGLLRLWGTTLKADTVKELNEIYITSFYQPLGDKVLYMSTLNHGLMRAENNKFRIVQGISPVKGTKQIVMTHNLDYRMIVVAGNKMFVEGSKDTINITGISKIMLVNDTIVYALTDLGIQRYELRQNTLVKKGEYFKDICFQPKASLAIDDDLYLGCNLGVLHFKALHEAQAEWIEIIPTILSRRLLLSLFIGFVILVFLLWLTIRINHCIKTRHILERKADLTVRINDLQELCELLPAYKVEEINKLKDELQQINPYGHASWKKINKQLRFISKQMTLKNRNTVLPLIKVVDSQRDTIVSLYLYESKQLIKDTDAALENGSIEQIRQQAVTNHQWITKVKAILERLHLYEHQLKDTLLLPHISEHLPTMIDNYRKEIAIYQLKDAEPLLNEIDHTYQLIFSDKALHTLQIFVEKHLQNLYMLAEQSTILSSNPINTLIIQLKQEWLHAPEADRIMLLRRMNHLNAHIQQVICLQQLRTSMNEFATIRQQVVQQNEERINKLFDRKLDAEIAEYTQEQTKQIAIHIETLYHFMDITDHTLLTTTLQFTSYNNQQTHVLALLMADNKVKRYLIPGMLKVIVNLNPVISRLVNNKLKPHHDEIMLYAERHPTSLATYILQLIA